METNKAKEGMHPKRIPEKQGRVRKFTLEHNARKFCKKAVRDLAVKNQITGS